MPVVPSSFVNEPLVKMKDLLEATARFPTWAAASGRVFYHEATEVQRLTRPYAVVGLGGIQGRTNAGGGTWHYGISGSLTVMFVADQDDNTVADQVNTFSNDTGEIVAQMLEISGGPTASFAIEEWAAPEEALLSDKKDFPNEVPFILALYEFSYGASPVR